MGHCDTPEDTANDICLICSDSASFINGQVTPVDDGGFDAAGGGLPTLPQVLSG